MDRTEPDLPSRAPDAGAEGRGLFIRPAQRATEIKPIEYSPPGSLKFDDWHYELDRLAEPVSTFRLPLA